MSITEDFTWEERMIMKEWFGKASERNEKEDNDDVKWCVRGSPRTVVIFKKKLYNVSVLVAIPLIS